MEELAELRARVDKLERVVGGLVVVLDTYVPRSFWTARNTRWDKKTRAQLDAVMELIGAGPKEPDWPRNPTDH